MIKKLYEQSLRYSKLMFRELFAKFAISTHVKGNCEIVSQKLFIAAEQIYMYPDRYVSLEPLSKKILVASVWLMRGDRKS